MTHNKKNGQKSRKNVNNFNTNKKKWEAHPDTANGSRDSHDPHIGVSRMHATILGKVLFEFPAPKNFNFP